MVGLLNDHIPTYLLVCFPPSLSLDFYLKKILHGKLTFTAFGNLQYLVLQHMVTDFLIINPYVYAE